MTWEETIQLIRTKPDYKNLVEKAYFDEDLVLNVERFRSSEEYAATVSLIKEHAPTAKSILDIGSGNGISAIAFALDGFDVTVSEPDASDTIGAGAIRKLKAHATIANMDIHEEFAENIQFDGKLFDIVYVRQAMHHAYDLNKFISNLAGLIKPGGHLFTIRDHVIYNEEDKKWFLQEHPLHKFYGGENAFTQSEYETAITTAGLTIKKVLKHFDSVINYFPLTSTQYHETVLQKEEELSQLLQKKIGILGKVKLLQDIYKKKNAIRLENVFNEKNIAGRMYSFVAQKA